MTYLFGLPFLFLGLSPGLDGSWKLSYSPSAGLELTDCLLQVETTREGLTGRVLAAAPRRGATAVVRVDRDGDQVRLVLQTAIGEQTFQGRVADDDVILGSYGKERQLSLARLTRTRQLSLEKNDLATVRRPLPEPMRKLADLNRDVALFRFQAAAAKDAADKDALLRKLAEAERSVETQTRGLYEEVVARHADSPAVFEAGLGLLWSAARHKALPERAAGWAQALLRAAEAYGLRWQREIALQAAEALASQPGFGAAALDLAACADRLRTPQDGEAHRTRVLKALAAAHLRAGQAAEAREVQARLAPIEESLDEKHRRDFPPLQVPRLDAADAPGGRAAVLEFFTGAHCRSCGASYLAFDALLKTYRPGELVVLQYHLHRPAPDPLANPDAEARWGYYAGAYPRVFRDVPAILLDGQPEAAGGHVSHAKRIDTYKDGRRKYNLYTEVIDRRREAAPAVRLAVEAARQGNRVAIRVEVRGLPDPGEGKRLRLAVAEDAIRHAGPNGLRFHPRVVRALPAGPAGVALRTADGEHRFEVSLRELRDAQQRQLDDYAARRPGTGLELPTDLHDLWVIAFVQDDTTREVLQGCQTRLSAGPPGK